MEPQICRSLASARYKVAKLDVSPEALLRWYLEAGVDEAIREIPVNRYRQPEPSRAFTPARPPQPPEETPDTTCGSNARRGGNAASTVPMTTPVESAFADARLASSLDEL